MSIAVHAVRRSGLRAGQEAVIVGIGGIGAFITVAAAATGARVLVVDLNQNRLDLATRLGAGETLLAGEATLPDRLAELGMDPDVFFEVSGSAPGLASVLSAAQPGATIVPLGIQKGDVPVPLGQWTLREYTIIGSVAHVLATDMPEAVRLLGTRPDWSDLAHEVLPLDRVVDDALIPLSTGKPGQIKTLIDPVDRGPAPGGALVTRTLITNAAVVTMDAALGDFERADILIEDGTIVKVAPGIEADAERIDASTMIAMPGMVDTHRHTWQTALRGMLADGNIPDYLRGIRLQMAPRYRAEDMYVGNYLGALDALNSGVTSLVDYCHNILDPDCAHGAVTGLLDAGIRGLYGHGMTPITENTWSESKGGAGGGRRVAVVRAARRSWPATSSRSTSRATISRCASASCRRSSRSPRPPRWCASSRSPASSAPA